MSKNCSICLYNEGLRIDGTYKCITPERQKDEGVTDCCIPEEPLRKIQTTALRAGVQNYFQATHQYVEDVKAQSVYWQKQHKASD